MSKREAGGERSGEKSWAQLREEAGWLGILSVGLWLYAAITLLFYGGVLSAIFGAIAGLMAWTPSFIDLRAQGKRTLSGGGRVAAGVVCFLVSIAMHPASDKEATTVKADVEPARSSEVTSTLSKTDAFRKCQEATLDKISHPSTADFNGWDTTFEQIANESRFSVGLTAKNGFGLELKLISTCVFDGDTLTLNHIAETR